MDITVQTSEPHEVSANEILDALETAGYHVNSIRIYDRAGLLDSAIALAADGTAMRETR